LSISTVWGKTVTTPDHKTRQCIQRSACRIGRARNLGTS